VIAAAPGAIHSTDMDAIALLKKDHDTVEELFARYNGGGGLTGLVKRVTGTVPARQKKTAVEGIRRELDVHTRIEEEIFYPASGGRATPSSSASSTSPCASTHARRSSSTRWRAAGRARRGHGCARLRAAAVRRPPREGRGERDVPRVEEVVAEDERGNIGRELQARKQELRRGTGRAAVSARRAGGARSRPTTRRTKTGRKTAGRKGAARKKRVRAR
jgi:hypothetical protein